MSSFLVRRNNVPASLGSVVYMVKNNRTGLYSQGGIPPTWGKYSSSMIWRSLGGLKRHLLQAEKWAREHKVAVQPGEEIEIREYLVMTPINRTPLPEFNVGVEGRSTATVESYSAALPED